MDNKQTVKLMRPGSPARWVKLYLLYRQAFPAAERKPWAMILQMCRKGVTDIWCMERAGSFAGLAITINGPDIILLDYLAVAPECRGQGVGSQALQLLRSHYGDKGLFVEIESTLEPSGNREQRLKRKRFYLAAGMDEMHTTAKLFGVNMELLGYSCHLSYEEYKSFYRDNYNKWAADHIAHP